MAFDSREYYLAFYDILVAAKAWMEDKGIPELGYTDIAFFRIVTDKTIRDAPTDLVEEITSHRFIVDFLKLTAQIPASDTPGGTAPGVKMYSYTNPNPGVPLLVDDTTVNGEFGVVGCKYMPEGWEIPIGHELNPTQEVVKLGRQDQAKEACDYMDEHRIGVIRSYYWKTKFTYPNEDRWVMPPNNRIHPMDDNVIKAVSFLALIGHRAYTMTGKGKSGNGIIVTPSLMLYNQVCDSLLIAKQERNA